MFAIEDTNLTVQIRTNHPRALCVEVAGHAHVLLVFNCSQMSTIECEGLNPSVAAVGNG
jgi:hypothetical protein